MPQPDLGEARDGAAELVDDPSQPLRVVGSLEPRIRQHPALNEFDHFVGATRVAACLDQFRDVIERHAPEHIVHCQVRLGA